MENEILKHAATYVCSRASFQSKFRLVRELAPVAIRVAVACRVLNISASGYSNGSDGQNRRAERATGS